MATTTPNYGWPVPTSGDLVKDGATAIEALGDAIDATLFAQSSGLTKISTTSFTSSSAVNLPASTFTTTYDNYIILVNATFGSASGSLYGRMRASGTDNTDSQYIRQYMRGTSTSVATNTDTGTFFNIADITNSYRNIVKIELNQPASAVVTTGHVIGSRSGYVNLTTLTHNVTTAFDSMTIYPDTSTITGKISVYGYKI